MKSPAVDILLGLQWGDEGKGKIVDVLAPQYDIVARFQGGPNAGHTLEFDGSKHVLHTIPSGIFHPGVMNLIGNGVVIDPIVFTQEIRALEARGVEVRSRLILSRRAHLILPSHKALDAASEAEKGRSKIGSTLKGIGPAYTDKTGRNGLRIGDLHSSDFTDRYDLLVRKHRKLLSSFGYAGGFEEEEKAWMEGVECLRSFDVTDCENYLDLALREGRKILAEGAQGSLLDIDFGSYPFVTSSTTIAAGACSGLGIAPNRTGRVIGIFKAYCTRVGSGPFPTELTDETGEALRKWGREFGSTTGRARRCGWLDLPALRYACMINGVTELYMMKADVLSMLDTLRICTHYQTPDGLTDVLPFDLNNSNVKPVYTDFHSWKKDLTGIRHDTDFPDELKSYVGFIERNLNIPIRIISVGPDREQTITRTHNFS